MDSPTEPADARPADARTADDDAGAETARLDRTDLRAIAVFLLLAFGLSWLVALPLWLGDGLASPLFPAVAIAMMLTPAAASLATVFLVERPARPWRALGILPLKPVPRLIAFLALGLVVPIALVLAALPVGALLGVYTADLTDFSGFRSVLDEQLAAASAQTGAPVPELPIPLGLLIVIQLVSIPFGAFINLIPALGEELGWRGWLLPKLLKLGTLPALLISGVVWGLWHAPLILLGYNYPGAPGWLGLLMMIGMCTLVGAVFSWLRIRSQSVWPAALAHGAFNAAAGSYVLFAAAGSTVDTTQATILGWSGWIAPLALGAVLLATGRFAAPSTHPAAAPVNPA